MITVIVPCYNAAPYIDECIASLKHQDSEDFEVVLVDNGSVDDTVNIIGKQIAGDERFRLLCMAHRGTSAARNRAIEEAHGNYVTFVDADDSVSPSYVSTLWRESNGGKIDLVVQSLRQVSTSDLVDISVRREGVYLLATSSESVFESMDMASMGSACGKLFKKTLIEKHGLKFLEELRMCEDQNFVIRYLSEASTVCLSRTINYRYLSRPHSSSKCINTYDVETACFERMDSDWQNLLNRFTSRALRGAYSEFVGSYVHRILYSALNHPHCQGPKMRWKTEFESKVRPLYKRIYHPKTRFTQLLFLCVSRGMYSAFNILMKLAGWRYSISYSFI